MQLISEYEPDTRRPAFAAVCQLVTPSLADPHVMQQRDCGRAPGAPRPCGGAALGRRTRRVEQGLMTCHVLSEDVTVRCHRH